MEQQMLVRSPNNSPQRRQRVVRSTWRFTPALIVATLCFGCAQKESNVPPTFPVVGTVVDSKGNPQSGGSIEFVANDNQDLLAVSNVAEDGSYELSTYLNGEKAMGAVAGEHTVTVYTQQIEHGDSSTITLQTPITVEAGDNELEIKLPRMKRR